MRRYILATILFLALVGAAHAATPSDTPASERRTALVIGNSDYELISPLRNPVNDARAMARVLSDLGFEVIAKENLDRYEMRKVIRDFGRKLGQGGVGLFYYAGHGIEVGGENFMIPLNAPIQFEDDVDVEAVSVNLLLAKLATAANRLNIVILDACRNNPYSRSFRSSASGLATMDAPSGTYIAYAAAPGRVAMDGEGDNGLYTGELLKALPLPGLKIEDTFKRVRVAVQDTSGAQQVPWESSSLTGDFYFVSASEAPQDTPSHEIVFWQSIEDSDNPKMFDAYLENYPDGAFTKIAELKRELLLAAPKQKSETDDNGVPRGGTWKYRWACPGCEAIGVPTTGVEGYFSNLDDCNASRIASESRASSMGGGFETFSCEEGLELLDQMDPLPRVGGANVAIDLPATPIAKTYKPGDTFLDCFPCPEMVVVPAGQFMMGSPSDEEGRNQDEGPQHRVTIRKPFAVGKYEVTFWEWNACVTKGGCIGYLPDDERWGLWLLPVINVSWEDAQAYLRWLSRESGANYRLLSEAEWEYAARAGTTTPFHFGSTISSDQANYRGTITYGSGRKSVDRKKTVLVRSFSPNAFGLHNVHGNVWEWVADCYKGSYARAPKDGGAWTTGDCSKRVLRSGSWFSTPWNVRSAYRNGIEPDDRSRFVGFRVARTLP